MVKRNTGVELANNDDTKDRQITNYPTWFIDWTETGTDHSKDYATSVAYCNK